MSPTAPECRDLKAFMTRLDDPRLSATSHDKPRRYTTCRDVSCLARKAFCYPHRNTRLLSVFAMLCAPETY